MKSVILGIFVLAVLAVSGCALFEENPQLAPKNIISIGESGGGSTPSTIIPIRPIYTLADLPEPFVVDGSYDDVAMVVSEGEAIRLTAAITTLRTYFDAFINDYSVPNEILDTNDLSYYDNLILVGSPCYNRAVAEYMGLTYPACGVASTIGTDTGIIKIVQEDDKTALIIVADETSDNYYNLLKKGANMVAAGGLAGTEIDYGVDGGSATVTYQGILDMLENAETHLAWYPYSCSDICEDYGGNCITAAQVGSSGYEAVPCNFAGITNHTNFMCRCAYLPI